MALRRNMATWFDGRWSDGAPAIMHAADHGTWQGSLVFDGARAFEGVTPDLDLHCARVNASAEALGLDPVLPTQEIVALAQEGLSRFADDAAVYIRPMVWAEESDAGTVPPLGSSSAFALCLEAIPMAPPTGFPGTTASFPRPTLGVMPVNAKAPCLYPNNARMMREAKAKGF